MKQLAWMTDLHLNFLTPAERLRFLETVRDHADAMYHFSIVSTETGRVVSTLVSGPPPA